MRKPVTLGFLDHPGCGIIDPNSIFVMKYKSRWTSFLTTPISTISNKELHSLQQHLNRARTVLNIGSGSSTRLARPILNCIPKQASITNLDIKDYDEVDIIADCHDIPLPECSTDVIVAFAVLEHLENPVKAAKEIERITKTGGYILLTVPFLQGYHADPNDFTRYTLYGLPTLFSGSSVVISGVSSGPFSAIAWILRDILSIGEKYTFQYSATRFASSILTYPIMLLDKIPIRGLGYQRCACEYYYLLKKN
jgi:SAM-dependent methyltransferase